LLLYEEQRGPSFHVNASNRRFAFGEVPAIVAAVSMYEERERVRKISPRFFGLPTWKVGRKALSWMDSHRCT
jgi:hypothetical protein